MINWVWAGPQQPQLNATIKDWVAEIIWPGQGQRFDDTAISLGILENDALIAAVVFHDWNPHAGVIEMSAASISKRWLTRPVLAQMFGYVFDGAKCQMAILRVSADRRQSHLHRILTAYGFDHARIPRLYGRDEDGLVFTLTDDAWRSNGFH